MSLHNKLEQYPRLLQAFNLATGLLENEEGVQRLGETLTPTIDIWNGRREWALLRGEQWYCKAIGVPGVALQNGAVGLGNPSGSGIVVVLTRASSRGAVGPVLYSMIAYPYAVLLGNYAPSQDGIPMDRRRVGLQAASQATVFRGTTAAVPGGGFACETVEGPVSTTMRYEALPQVLYPGDAILFYKEAAGENAQQNLVWYERKCVANEARGGV